MLFFEIVLFDERNFPYIIQYIIINYKIISKYFENEVHIATLFKH